MTFSKFILAFSLIGLLNVGCGSNNNFSSNDASSTDGTNRGSSDNSENSENNNEEGNREGKTSFTFSSSVQSNFFGNGQVFKYDSDSNKIEVAIPFPLAAVLFEVSGTLPKHPNVSFRVDPVARAIVFSIPVKNYLDIVRNPDSLPNGRPLPGVNGGEPPSFGLPLGFLDLDAYAYAAVDSISLYIESSLDLPLTIKVPLTSDQTDKQVGAVHWLAPVNGYKGGVFLTLRLPKELSVIIANAQ